RRAGERGGGDGVRLQPARPEADARRGRPARQRHRAAERGARLMREKLNESKAAQVGLVLVLAAVVAFMLLGKGSSSSGAEVETAEIPTTEPTAETAAVVGAPAATGAGELPT